MEWIWNKAISTNIQQKLNFQKDFEKILNFFFKFSFVFYFILNSVFYYEKELIWNKVISTSIE